MKVFKIERTAMTDYCEYCGFAIIAEDEKSARQLAFQVTHQKTQFDWLDPLKSICTEIDTSVEQVFLSDCLEG